MKEDTRIIHTKTKIKNAFFTLLDQKPIRRIRVMELCEIAQINRSTYYDYYSDIYALLEEVENDLFEEMNIHATKSLSAYLHQETSLQKIALFEVVTFMKQNRHRFLTLLKYNEENRFEHHLFAFFSEKILRREYWHHTLDIKKKYEFLYHMSGSFSVLRQWILDDCIISEEEITKLLFPFFTT